MVALAKSLGLVAPSLEIRREKLTTTHSHCHDSHSHELGSNVKLDTARHTSYRVSDDFLIFM